MPEYLGYTSRGEGVDFAGEARKLADQITGIEQRRTLEKEELDAMNNLDMQLFQSGNNQTMNDFALNGADVIRGNMHTWNKQLKAGMLSPKEYKAKITNARADWGSLAEIAKTYDQRFMKQMERQRPDENGKIAASGLETYMLEHFADLADLESKSVYVDPNTGRVLLSNTDEQGLFTGQPFDMNHINNPGNVIDARLDVADTVSSTVKNWEAFEAFELGTRGATNKYVDVRLNNEYDKASNQLAISIIKQPNAVASIINDNGVSGSFSFSDEAEGVGKSYDIYSDFYMTDEDKDMAMGKQLDNLRKLMEISGDKLTAEQEDKFLSEVEKYMIKVSKDPNGTATAQPTKDQEQLAIDRIKSEIEITLGHEEKGSAPWKPTPRPSSKPKVNDETLMRGWEATKNAFRGNFSGLDTQNYDFRFVGAGGKIPSGYSAPTAGLKAGDTTDVGIVLIRESNIVEGRRRWQVIDVADSPNALADYTLPGRSPSENQELWYKAQEKFGKTNDKEDLRKKYDY
jgi:hypothetical protein